MENISLTQNVWVKGGDGGKQFPRAACMIDILRNSLAFTSAGQILAAFRLLERQEGFQLVRYKNKFRVDTKMPFRNLMVNVLFHYTPEGTDATASEPFSIVGELQLTTVGYVRVKNGKFLLLFSIQYWKTFAMLS